VLDSARSAGFTWQDSKSSRARLDSTKAARPIFQLMISIEFPDSIINLINEIENGC